MRITAREILAIIPPREDSYGIYANLTVLLSKAVGLLEKLDPDDLSKPQWGEITSYVSEIKGLLFYLVERGNAAIFEPGGEDD